MTIREDLMAAAARVQRGMVAKAGDRFIRGLQLVEVTAVEDGEVTWVDVATGAEHEGDRRAFTGRALRRVKPPPAIDIGTIADAVWALAGARTLTPAERLGAIRDTYPNAYAGQEGTERERAMIAAWLRTLRAGGEPVPNPRVEVDA